MTILTAGGSFASEYLTNFDASIVSFRELDETAFMEKLRSAKTVIHNAATIDVADIEMAVSRNFDFTRFLIGKLLQVNPSVHLVFMSSMSILDPTNDANYGNPVKMTPYAYSKYLAETFALLSLLEHVSCIRFSTLFYEDPKKDGLSKLIHDAVTNGHITILNKGEATRNFLPLRVAAAYTHLLAEKPEKNKTTNNFAAPNISSFQDIAKILKKHLPDLVVDEKKFDGPSIPVLADFSMADVNKIGPISFSLEDEIVAYINKLKT